MLEPQILGYAHGVPEAASRPRSPFSGPPTILQNTFDVLAGMVMPLVCLYRDPFVFRELLPQFRGFCYPAIGVEIVLLGLWLIIGPRWKPVSSVAAVSLLAGSLLAGVLGLILLPLSALGLGISPGIAVFGFTPLFTWFAYLRNGVRAVGHAFSGY